MDEANECKTSRKKSGGMVLPIVIWAICGLLIALLAPQIDNAESAAEIIIGVWIPILAFYLALIVQVIIHESGHLVCGLISGYKFNMFRIFSFALAKVNGKIKFKRYGIAGTAGQCLMLPPEEKNGKFPVVLYNLGGIIFNALGGVIFLVVYIFCDMTPFAKPVCLHFGYRESVWRCRTVCRCIRAWSITMPAMRLRYLKIKKRQEHFAFNCLLPAEIPIACALKTCLPNGLPFPKTKI